MKEPFWKLVIGWSIIIAVLYAGHQIPRLPFLLDLVGRLPSWLLAAGGIAWGMAVLGLTAVSVAPRRLGSKPGLVLPSLAVAVVLTPLPIYLLRQDEGWQVDLGGLLGLLWIGMLLISGIAFLVRAQLERRRPE